MDFKITIFFCYCSNYSKAIHIALFFTCTSIFLIKITNHLKQHIFCEFSKWLKLNMLQTLFTPELIVVHL